MDLALIHAPQTVAYRNISLPVYAILPDHGEAVSKLYLKYQAKEKSFELRMLPIDGYLHEDSYSLYAATIPAEHMQGNVLIYSFYLEGLQWSNYTVPLEDAPERLVADGEAPCMLPVGFPDRYYLAGGDLVLRVVTFGREVEPPVAVLLHAEKTEEITAVYTDSGEYTFTVPFALLCRLGEKLRLYFRARSSAYTAHLGSAKKPLSVRLVDNVGPTLTCVTPADGVCVQERMPTIRAEFFDASGVSGRTSVLCLDGQNFSGDAVWGADRVLYTPKRALKRGAHTVELTLRDKLGNRTYYRTHFFVGKEMQGPAKKSPRAMELMAKAIGALRGLKEK